MKFISKFDISENSDAIEARLVHGDQVFYFGFSKRNHSSLDIAEHLTSNQFIKASYCPKQVHSNQVVEVPVTNATKISEKNEIFRVDQCDGLWTRSSQSLLMIQSADCLPMIFFTREAPMIIGILHSGWRGTQSNISLSMLQQITAHPDVSIEDLNILIGPCIRKCCYEVGREFEKIFDSKFLSRSSSTKDHFDLAAANVESLAFFGVSPDQIQDVGICTACENHKYFSYRKEGDKAGRMLSWVLRVPLKDMATSAPFSLL